MRLDKWLSQEHPEFSRSVWAKRIKNGEVRVNRRSVKLPKTEVNEADVVEISQKSSHIEAIDFPIIFEDENVVVIDKPAGVLTHAKGALCDEWTVADFFRQRAGSSDLPDNSRFGVVHRLDRATSGVIIGAKNAEALKFLQKQFAQRKAKKTYLALVEKSPAEPAATIDLPIARNPKAPSTFRVDPRGKNAVTAYNVLETYSDGSALVELKPQTGRTHQLRVHLAYIGAPIVGDAIYGAGGERMFLHARELEITIPGGERKVFRAEIPKEFNELIVKKHKKGNMK